MTIEVCRVYLTSIKLDGTPNGTTRVTVENLYRSPVQGAVVVESAEVFAADEETGIVEFSLPQGGRFRVSIADTPICKEIDVPEEEEADLATLLGDPMDSFTVIET
jgi:hypothetical protein